jgi:hypothetical protein
MDEHSTSPPKGVQYRGGVGWRHIDIETEGPEGVSAVHENITQAHRLGESREAESSVGRRAETISQLRDRHVSKLFGCVIHRSIWSKPASNKDACQ